MKRMLSMGFLGLMCCTMLMMAGSANAGFMDAVKSVSGLVAPATGGGELNGQLLDGTFKLFAEADGLLQKSVDNLVKIVCNKEVVDELNRKMQTAETIQDPKEREAAIRQVREEQQAALEADAEKKETADKLAQLSTEQKMLAGNSISNFMLAGLKNAVVVKQVTDIVSMVKANPSAAIPFVGEVSRIKDLVVTLPSQVSKITQIGGHLVTLAKTSKIEVTVPKSATESAKEIKEFS